MTDDMGAIIEKIRRNVFAEAEEAFAAESFQRWRYSLYNARMNDADAVACLQGGCGEAMEIYLKFRNNRVEKASYVTDGCCLSSLCGSYTAEMTIGKSPQQVLEITAVDVLRRAGRSGKEVEKCALFAVEALHTAVNNYHLRQIGAARRGQPNKIPRFITTGKVSPHLLYIN